MPTVPLLCVLLAGAWIAPIAADDDCSSLLQLPSRVRVKPITGNLPTERFPELSLIRSSSVKRFQLPPSEMSNWIAVDVLLLLMAFALSPVLVLRGGSAAFLLGCYLASLLGVKLLVKKMISLGFPYPDSINAFHMAGVVLVTLITQLSYTSCRSSTVTVTGGSESGHDPPRAQCGWATEAMEVLPIALLSGLSLITGPSPRGLAYGTPSLTMIHAHVPSEVPLFTYAYELFKQKRQMDSRSILAVLLACGGSAFCVQGVSWQTELLLGLSIPVTVSSALLAASSATLRAVRGVWQEELTRRSRRSPMRVVLWSSVWCLFLSCIFMCYNDGLAAFRALGTASVELKLMFAGSMVASIGLNVSQILVVKRMGALLQSIIGNLHVILLLALSQAFLHEMIMPYQYLGIILLAIGTFVSKVDAHEKEAAPGPNLDDFLHRKLPGTGGSESPVDSD
ncbi:unnamed protein product [Durusdinium trenchii]|uniref:Uncharacterized protein n=1 Tax=Durusdinium trenchii TaxID=1381693 RepID=A0ABP0P7P3_9DINO